MGAILFLKKHPTFSFFAFLCSSLFPTLSFHCVNMKGERAATTSDKLEKKKKKKQQL